jgi:hypothetical protein
MNSSRKIIVAAAVSVLLHSAIASADSRQFNTPSTEQAQKSAQLLRRAAEGFYASPLAGGNRADGQQVSDLWLFPTADAHTVFARYTLGANDPSRSPNQHLTVLTLDGDQIVAARELTDEQPELTRDDGAKPAAPASDGPHWSAAIGTGHALDTRLPRSSTGLPASADWTASIGTGKAAVSTGATPVTELVSSVSTGSTVQAHWSSKIGTGRASEPQVGSTSAQHAASIAAVVGVER